MWHNIQSLSFNPFPNNKFYTSKLEEFTDNNFKFDENAKKLSKTLREKEKLLVTSNFSFSNSVFKGRLETRKKKGLSQEMVNLYCYLKIFQLNVDLDGYLTTQCDSVHRSIWPTFARAWLDFGQLS